MTSARRPASVAAALPSAYNPYSRKKRTWCSSLSDVTRRLLDEINDGYLNDLRTAVAEFTPISLTSPILINSVPKCGTHLLRNILLAFAGFDCVVTRDFVQSHSLSEYAGVFSTSPPALSWGHLGHGDEAYRLSSRARILTVVRDPYDYVLSFTRFLYAYQEQAPFAQYVKQHNIPVDRTIAAVIFGNNNDENLCVDLRTTYVNNAIAWLGGASKMVRYEDIIAQLRMLDAPSAEAFFLDILTHCEMALPDDWRRRVRIGADRKFSATARENLAVWTQIPDELTTLQKQMVEFAAPGLRNLLGYI